MSMGWNPARPNKYDTRIAERPACSKRVLYLYYPSVYAVNVLFVSIARVTWVFPWIFVGDAHSLGAYIRDVRHVHFSKTGG